MDAGSRSGAIAPPRWGRALALWMLIMLVETVHGALREIFIAPLIGGLRARQIGVLVGCVLIFLIAWAGARWLGAITRRVQLIVGALWVALTLLFEFGIGRALGFGWLRLLSDYNPARGGFMLLGLAFMFFAPMLTARLRAPRAEESR